MWSVYSYADAPMRVRAQFETMEDAVAWGRARFGEQAEVRSPLPDQHDPAVVAAERIRRLEDASVEASELRAENRRLESALERARERLRAAAQEIAR
jgi:hypothetical protein